MWNYGRSWLLLYPYRAVRNVGPKDPGAGVWCGKHFMLPQRNTLPTNLNCRSVRHCPKAKQVEGRPEQFPGSKPVGLQTLTNKWPGGIRQFCEDTQMFWGSWWLFSVTYNFTFLFYCLDCYISLLLQECSKKCWLIRNLVYVSEYKCQSILCLPLHQSKRKFLSFFPAQQHQSFWI